MRPLALRAYDTHPMDNGGEPVRSYHAESYAISRFTSALARPFFKVILAAFPPSAAL